MFPLPHSPKTVEAHGESWVTLHMVTATDTHTFYLASRASQPMPAEVMFIQVSREWEREQFNKEVAKLRNGSPTT